MRLSYSKRKSNPADRKWCFLSEFSLGEWMSDRGAGDSLIAGWLEQAGCHLGITPECLQRMEKLLVESVRQKREHFNQGEIGYTILIRLFVQKKMFKPGKSNRLAGDDQRKRRIEPAQIFPPAWVNRIGGWGFFIIEKGRDLTSGSTLDSPAVIELYLYQEADLQNDKNI